MIKLLLVMAVGVVIISSIPTQKAIRDNKTLATLVARY